MKYKFEITITSDASLLNSSGTISPIMPSYETITIENNFENEYQVKSEVKNIGSNGLMIWEEKVKMFFPPHRIFSISIWKLD